MAARYNTGLIIQVPKPCSWTREYSHKKYENQSSSQKSFATTWYNVFTTNIFEKYDLKAPDLSYSLIFLMSFACHLHALVFYPYVHVCHWYVSRMYSYVICMSLVYKCLYVMVCHSYVLVCNPHVTRIYSYVIRMSTICSPMSPVCHSYVPICHPYVTRMYSYVMRMSLVCGFTMKCLKLLQVTLTSYIHSN